MAKEEKSLFYVGVRNPIELRRTVLESSKDAIENLQRYERFKALKEEKAKHIGKLRATIKELHKLVGKLKEELPETSLVADETRARPQKFVKGKESKSVEPKKELTELEKLESELDVIEKRIGNIK